MMNFLSQSININNEAVGLIQSDQPKEAVDMLGHALKVLRSSFSVPTKTTTTPPPTVVDLPPSTNIIASATVQLNLPQQDNAMSSPFNESFSSIYSDTSDSMDTSLIQDNYRPLLGSVPADCLFKGIVRDGGLLSIYDRAIIVSPEESNIDAVSSAIMYNMGLLSHIRGLSLGKTTSLARALRLYRMSLALLMKCKDEAEDERIVLKLALFNNMAQLYGNNFEAAMMRQCLDFVRSLLECVRDESVEGQEEYWTFYVNSLCTKGQEICAAPAA